MRKLPYGKQSISKKDIEAVTDVLNGEWLTQGPAVEEFEKALADHCGAEYAVAVSNGTAALHLACLAAGLGPGDEAITTPVTFLSTPNSVLYTGAVPVFADIDPDTINISPSEIRKNISTRTKAVLPVHFAGLACDMEEISAIAGEHGLTVIEDACHALGAEYMSGESSIKIGSCRHSDMTVFSFHPIKHITTGEGGAVTTNSYRIYKELKKLRAHGVEKTPEMGERYGPWYYEMTDLGYNYRITDFQCALGISQLGRIDSFIKKRGSVAELYRKRLSDMPPVRLQSQGDGKHAYHLFVARLDFDRLGRTRKQLFNCFEQKIIYPQVHYIPVYRQPYYKNKLKLKGRSYPNSEKYYKSCISLPLFAEIKTADINRVMGVLDSFIKTT